MQEENTPVAAPAAESAPVESEAVESQEVEGSEEVEQESAPSPKEAKQIAKNIKKLKLKVDGEEIEEEFDLDNEKELVNRLQLAKAAQKRMQESAELRKQVENFVKFAQQSPEKALADLGINAEEFAVKFLQDKVNQHNKTPEQLEKEKLEAELQELRAKYKEDEDNRKKAEFERLQVEAERKLEDGITTALNTSGLPKSPLVVKKMAEMMYLALENNIDLNPQDVVPLVRRELENDIKEFFGAAPDEMVEQLLGKERINNFRKKQVAALKQKKVVTASDIKPTGEAKKADDGKQAKKISMDEWLRG